MVLGQRGLTIAQNDYFSSFETERQEHRRYTTLELKKHYQPPH